MGRIVDQLRRQKGGGRGRHLMAAVPRKRPGETLAKNRPNRVNSLGAREGERTIRIGTAPKTDHRRTDRRAPNGYLNLRSKKQRDASSRSFGARIGQCLTVIRKIIDERTEGDPRQHDQTSTKAGAKAAPRLHRENLLLGGEGSLRQAQGRGTTTGL